MGAQVKVMFRVDTSRLRRQLDRGNAMATQRRINRLRRRGHDRAAESVRKAYYFQHGTTPAEHALQLRVTDALASDRWSPQP